MSQNQTTSPSGLVALSCTLPIICIFAICLRFWLRNRQKSPLRADDWLMLPALLFFIGMCSCSILGVRRKVWGYPTPDPDHGITDYNNNVSYESKLLEAYQFIQILTLGTIKLGALLFYRRIFSTGAGPSKFNNALHLCIAVTAWWTVAMTIMNALQCGSHIAALWTTDVDQYIQYCTYAFPFLMGFAISNFILDVIILALPLPKIWALHASNSRKLAVTGVFGLAAIGLAASAVRMGIYISFSEDGPSATTDIHLEDTESIFWSDLEAGMSLLAVNLPSLWAIFGRMSTPASKLVASIRSALSLRSLGSDGGHHSMHRGVEAGGSQINIIHDAASGGPDSIKGQSKGWHQLREMDDSRTHDVDSAWVPSGTGYDNQRVSRIKDIV